MTKSTVQIFSGNPSTSTRTFIHLMLWDVRYLKTVVLFVLLHTTEMFPSWLLHLGTSLKASFEWTPHWVTILWSKRAGQYISFKTSEETCLAYNADLILCSLCGSMMLFLSKTPHSFNYFMHHINNVCDYCSSQVLSLPSWGKILDCLFFFFNRMLKDRQETMKMQRGLCLNS